MPNASFFYPPEAVERYRKLKAMADNAGAAPNERGLAARKLGELEAEYPGIGIEATRPAKDPSAPVPSIFDHPLFHQAKDVAKSLFEGLDQSMKRDKALDRMVRIESGVNRSGKFTLLVEIKADAFDKLLDSVERDATLRTHVEQWLGNRVSAEFAHTIKEMLDEADEDDTFGDD